MAACVILSLMIMAGCSQSHIDNPIDQAHAPQGGGWESLLNGEDLSGWHAVHEDRPMSWKVVDGMLANQPGSDHRGTNIATDETFEDFELYYEYRYPEGSNSGVYLRGRYEIQIFDDGDKEPGPGTNGGIWATAAPRVDATKGPNEWQSIYAKLVGKEVTVYLNGKLIHDKQHLPKPTGGHLDENVGEPGPIMIQGDHGPVDFREIWIRPLGCCGKVLAPGETCPDCPSDCAIRE
jgi:hypothetical protein